MITQRIWMAWTLLSTVSERLLNLVTHSLTVNYSVGQTNFTLYHWKIMALSYTWLYTPLAHCARGLYILKTMMILHTVQQQQMSYIWLSDKHSQLPIFSCFVSGTWLFMWHLRLWLNYLYNDLFWIFITLRLRESSGQFADMFNFILWYDHCCVSLKWSN